MPERVRLGFLTPSSNTVLEPVIYHLLRKVPEVTAHFSRFTVTEIAVGGSADAQFTAERMVEAAKLLADARCHVIAWCGTAASWLGFETDEALCASLARATGALATTSVLALNEVLAGKGYRRIGLVTPYAAAVQERIIANYERIGIACAAERHLSKTVNYSFAETTDAEIRSMVLEVAAARPDAIAIVCTNLRGAPLVDELERTTGIPVLDSVAVAVWKCLVLAGIDPRRVGGSGALFAK